MAYTLPKKPGEEIWTCNTAYGKPTFQKNIDRLYFMDPLETFPDYLTFIEDVNSLDCDVVCQKHYNEIPRSRTFPRDDVFKITGINYYASTISYMLADAVKEHPDALRLYHINASLESKEYLNQKACHDFWCGYARGCGIDLKATTDTWLMKNYPWCAPIYGYMRYKNETESNFMLRRCVNQIMRMPIEREF